MEELQKDHQLRQKQKELAKVIERQEQEQMKRQWAEANMIDNEMRLRDKGHRKEIADDYKHHVSEVQRRRLADRQEQLNEEARI